MLRMWALWSSETEGGYLYWDVPGKKSEEKPADNDRWRRTGWRGCGLVNNLVAEKSEKRHGRRRARFL